MNTITALIIAVFFLGLTHVFNILSINNLKKRVAKLEQANQTQIQAILSLIELMENDDGVYKEVYKQAVTSLIDYLSTHIKEQS